MRKLLLLSVIIALAYSCQRLETRRALDRASNLLYERPDSSLAVLESIRIDGIPCKKDRARYALLKSAAFDKNYIDICSDSLIGIAVDYYAGHQGKDKQAMGAFYYKGIVLKNAGSYEMAIVSFEKAERIAESIGDNYHLGLINRNKSEIFNSCNNIKEAIVLEKKAIEYFDKANAQIYSLYAKRGLAVLYNNDKQYLAAAAVLDSIELYSPDLSFSYKCRLLRAEGIIAKNKNLREAILLYLSVPEEYYFITDYGHLALAYERIGQRDSSDLMINQAYHNARNELDSATVDFMHAHIVVNRKDYETAHDLVFHAALVQDSLTRVLLTQSINNAQRDFYRQEVQLQELFAKQKQRNGFLIIMIVILTSSLIIVTQLSRNRKKDVVIREQMAQLTLKSGALSETIKQNAILTSSLFNEKYFHLEKISSDFYSCTNETEREQLLLEFKRQCASFKDNQQLFSDLEILLNKSCNNVMQKIREQVPSIKGKNLSILSLFFSGMPYEIIQILIGSQSVFALRTAKTRFKKIILASNAKDKELFLSLLSTNQSIKDNI